MQFAVVGDAEEAIFFAEAIHHSDSHQLASCFVRGDLAAAMSDRGLPLDLVGSSEEAILDSRAEGVLVAWADSAESMAICRQVSQADRYVVVIPPSDASTAFSYELHLLLDESHFGIIPLAGRWYVDPESDQASSIGSPIRQLSAESGLPATKERPNAELNAIDGMAGMGFAYDRVTGFDLPGGNGDILARNITLASASDDENAMPPAVFSFKSDCDSPADAVIHCLTQKGSQSLKTALPRPSRSTLAISSGPMVDRVVMRLQDAEACQTGMAEFSNTLEIVGALARSLRRRRTIDVYFDGISERGVFKTQMTAIGCGILGYATFGLIAYLIFAKLAEPAVWVLNLARIVWFGPVVLFLLAQLLLPIARDRKSASDEDA